LAAPYPGTACSFYTNRGASTEITGEAMTQVGSTKTYYVTDRLHAWLDPNKAVVVKDGGSAITTGYVVDHAGAYVTLSATPSGAVTLDGWCFTMEPLGGGFGWSASKKSQALDATVYPAIAGTLANKSFIGSGICEWSGSLKRHFYYARASVTTAIGTANSELTWTWKGSGSFGNDEAIVYASGTPLEIARAANETTVTYVSASTIASAVKAHLEADTTLNALWELSYPVGNDGSGVVGDVAHVHASGGRDSTEQIAQVGTLVLCVFYLETSAATSARLEGVAVLTGVNFDDPLEALIESDLEFTGSGNLAYHAV